MRKLGIGLFLMTAAALAVACGGILSVYTSGMSRYANIWVGAESCACTAYGSIVADTEHPCPCIVAAHSCSCSTACDYHTPGGCGFENVKCTGTGQGDLTCRTDSYPCTGTYPKEDCLNLCSGVPYVGVCTTILPFGQNIPCNGNYVGSTNCTGG